MITWSNTASHHQQAAWVVLLSSMRRNLWEQEKWRVRYHFYRQVFHVCCSVYASPVSSFLLYKLMVGTRGLSLGEGAATKHKAKGSKAVCVERRVGKGSKVVVRQCLYKNKCQWQARLVGAMVRSNEAPLTRQIIANFSRVHTLPTFGHPEHFSLAGHQRFYTLTLYIWNSGTVCFWFMAFHYWYLRSKSVLVTNTWRAVAECLIACCSAFTVFFLWTSAFTVCW